MGGVSRPGGQGSPDRVARGLPTGGQGSKVYVLCVEPKEHKHFRPGARPGGLGYPARRIGDRGDREIVYVPDVYVPFPAILLTGIPGNALRAFPGSFRNFAGISSGKSQPYWGYGPPKSESVKCRFSKCRFSAEL